MTRTIGLAALTVLDAGPAGQIAAAAAAGFDAVGLRLNPLLATDPVVIGDAVAERAVRDGLRTTGLGVLDVGVVTLTESLDVAAPAPLMAFSAEIGARFLTCPVADEDRGRREATFAALCEAAARFSLTPLIEFNPYSACRTLGDAVGLVDGAGHANAGLCVDAFHLSRSGGHPDDLRRVPAERLRLLHFCDAGPLPAGPTSVEAIRAESRGGRLLPGEGSLWLAELLSALPADVPVSVEAPSVNLARLPVEERAAKALAATRRVLAAWERG